MCVQHQNTTIRMKLQSRGSHRGARQTFERQKQNPSSALLVRLNHSNHNPLFSVVVHARGWLRNFNNKLTSVKEYKFVILLEFSSGASTTRVQFGQSCTIKFSAPNLQMTGSLYSMNRAHPSLVVFDILQDNTVVSKCICTQEEPI